MMMIIARVVITHVITDDVMLIPTATPVDSPSFDAVPVESSSFDLLLPEERAFNIYDDMILHYTGTKYTTPYHTIVTAYYLRSRQY